ncbi:TrmH family RNA methyltransferase [Candidatus Pacearchaeota archaeon]|nr:MAG: TrmH family RNA methyltransferase [Candidatus Pacearchaeota archaeon]
MKKKKSPKEIIVVLDNIRSTYNVGAIFRSADAAGVNKVYLCGITPAPPNPKISKVALGAEDYIVWEKTKTTWRLLEKLKKEGYFIIALEQGKRAKNIFKNKFNKKQDKIVLLLGPEVKGLSSKILKRTDKLLEIPMFGKKESLNVAVAFGIAIYQICISLND